MPYREIQRNQILEEAARRRKNASEVWSRSQNSLELFLAKKTLIVAIRDLAINDKDFAVFVLPVLEEFKSVRGKLLQMLV